jgi:hypothetical protein
MRHYEKEAPGLLHTIKKNYWHKSCGTHQKLVVVRTLINRTEVEQWKNWGSVNRVKLGNWLIACVCEATGWFEKQRPHKVKRHFKLCCLQLLHFLQLRIKLFITSELFSPEALPMLIEPNDWSPQHEGGYLLNEVMRGHDMVRRGNPHHYTGGNLL